MTPRDFKDATYGELARLGKALSSPKRLEIIDLLAQGPRTVESIAAHIGQSVANTSRHLGVFRAARLVVTSRKGTSIAYSLADGVADILAVLRRLADRRYPEIAVAQQQYLAAHPAVDTIERDELVTALAADEVLLLDVRPATEYARAHLPGARNLPIDTLRDHLDDLDGGREIITYCRGPYCVWAIEAVTLLRASGFAARRFEDGISEWRLDGRVVELGP